MQINLQFKGILILQIFKEVDQVIRFKFAPEPASYFKYLKSYLSKCTNLNI